MVGKEIKGYRRTAFKTKYANLCKEKEQYFLDRNIEYKVVKFKNWYLIYIKR